MSIILGKKLENKYLPHIKIFNIIVLMEDFKVKDEVMDKNDILLSNHFKNIAKRGPGVAMLSLLNITGATMPTIYRILMIDGFNGFLRFAKHNYPLTYEALSNILKNDGFIYGSDENFQNFTIKIFENHFPVEDAIELENKISQNEEGISEAFRDIEANND